MEIKNFDNFVQNAIRNDGEVHSFFYHQIGNIEAVPFNSDKFDASEGTYHHQETLGPIFGSSRYRIGTVIVLIRLPNGIRRDPRRASA